MKLQIESLAYPKLVNWGDFPDSDYNDFMVEYGDALKKYHLEIKSSEPYAQSTIAKVMRVYIELNDMGQIQDLMADIGRDIIACRKDKDHPTNWLLICDTDIKVS